MTHHHARLVAVAIAAVSFSTPITAQQEPTPPATLEALLETLGGRVRQNEQGEVEVVTLSGTQVTDAGLAYLAGLTALEYLESEPDRNAAYQSLLWALLATNEFLFIH